MSTAGKDPIPFHLQPTAREFVFEKSSFYRPLWYRREVVLCDGPDDFTDLCGCGGSPGGLHFPHTLKAENRMAWMWGGMNGAN